VRNINVLPIALPQILNNGGSLRKTTFYQHLKVGLRIELCYQQFLLDLFIFCRLVFIYCMPYIPGLIREELKVLPEYFSEKDKTQPIRNESPVFKVLSILFIILSLVLIKKIWIALALFCVACICTSKGKRWLESNFRFNLTDKIRVIFSCILLLLCLPLYGYYQHLDVEEAIHSQLAQQHLLKLRSDSLKADGIRKDSLTFYISKSKRLAPQARLAALNLAAKYIALETEKSSVDTEVSIATLKFVNQLISQGNYRNGLDVVQNYLKNRASRPELIYKRAICYLKLDSIRLAVVDLDTAKSLGYQPANKLYNQVNPLRRRVAYYETLCSDGSSSSATGRGACSWHGGVAQWNHPVYETYRKY
jgi:hypothetical protein